MNLTSFNLKRTRQTTRGRVFLLVVASIVAYCSDACDEASAAQLRLRTDVYPQGALVVLGDVAEIVTNDPAEAEHLAAIELFPAPTASRKRFLDVYEMRDLLQRKIDMAAISLTGASRITVHGLIVEEEPEPEPEPMPVVARPVSSIIKKRAEHRVQEAVTGYLRQQAQSEGPWTVRFELTANQTQSHAEALANAEIVVFVTGGREPWTGSQNFTINIEGPEGLQRLTIDTIVTLPPAVVVAARPLTRGTLIREGDVRLDFQSNTRKGDATFDHIEDLIGLETTQSIAAGDAVVGRVLQKPLLVKAGDAVTVYARTGGIQVRTVARARDSGSMGELVSVESLNDRKAYFARVSGIQKVEVYARAVSAGGVMPEENAPGSPQPEELSAKFRSQMERAMYHETVATPEPQPQPIQAAKFEATSAPPVVATKPASTTSPTVLHPVTVLEPVAATSEIQSLQPSVGAESKPHAISNPSTPTRLRWTRRSAK